MKNVMKLKLILLGIAMSSSLVSVAQAEIINGKVTFTTNYSTSTGFGGRFAVGATYEDYFSYDNQAITGDAVSGFSTLALSYPRVGITNPGQARVYFAEDGTSPIGLSVDAWEGQGVTQFIISAKPAVWQYFVVGYSVVSGASGSYVLSTALASTVPEPQPYAMFVVGLGLLGGFALRCKQEKRR